MAEKRCVRKGNITLTSDYLTPENFKRHVEELGYHEIDCKTGEPINVKKLDCPAEVVRLNKKIKGLESTIDYLKKNADYTKGKNCNSFIEKITECEKSVESKEKQLITEKENANELRKTIKTLSTQNQELQNHNRDLLERIEKLTKSQNMVMHKLNLKDESKIEATLNSVIKFAKEFAEAQKKKQEETAAEQK